MRQPLVAWLAAGLFTVSSAAFGQSAFDGRVKVGVLNDQSSLYADATGQGSVVAAQMAAQDYMEANPNSKLKIEITFADHQNKPDIGANIARQWFEREGVDMILDVPNSSVALAVSGVARQLNKVMVNGSAGTARLTGDQCSPNTVHWTFDNYVRLPTAPAAPWSRPAATPGFLSPRTMRSATISRLRPPRSSMPWAAKCSAACAHP